MTRNLLRNTIAVVAIAAMTAAATGCATGASAATRQQNEATYVLLRHAEKAVDDPKDPSLSEAGRSRAQRVAARLSGVRMVAVYATGYRRTQLTAAPTAAAHGLSTRTYDAGLPAPELAARLRNAHAHGTVLVVGHSNTVAVIASALCNCEVAPLREDEFDRWIAVRIGEDGKASVEQSRY